MSTRSPIAQLTIALVVIFLVFGLVVTSCPAPAN